MMPGATTAAGYGPIEIMMLADLDLPPRTLNALERAGIRTLAQAAEWSDDDLLALPQFGRAGLAAVRAVIAKAVAADRREC